MLGIDILKVTVAHTDFIVEELIDGKIRVSSKSQKFDFIFDNVDLAMDFVTDIN